MNVFTWSFPSELVRQSSNFVSPSFSSDINIPNLASILIKRYDSEVPASSSMKISNTDMTVRFNLFVLKNPATNWLIEVFGNSTLSTNGNELDIELKQEPNSGLVTELKDIKNDFIFFEFQNRKDLTLTVKLKYRFKKDESSRSGNLIQPIEFNFPFKYNSSFTEYIDRSMDDYTRFIVYQQLIELGTTFRLKFFGNDIISKKVHENIRRQISEQCENRYNTKTTIDSKKLIIVEMSRSKRIKRMLTRFQLNSDDPFILKSWHCGYILDKDYDDIDKNTALDQESGKPCIQFVRSVFIKDDNYYPYVLCLNLKSSIKGIFLEIEEFIMKSSRFKNIEIDEIMMEGHKAKVRLNPHDSFNKFIDFFDKILFSRYFIPNERGVLKINDYGRQELSLSIQFH